MKKLMMKKLILMLALIPLVSAVLRAQVPLGGHTYVPSTTDSNAGQTNVVMTDADCTLTSPGSACAAVNTGGYAADAPYLGTLKVTSSVSLTSTRTINVVMSPGRQYTVFNQTTGGQSLNVCAAASCVLVPNGSAPVIVVSEGSGLSEIHASSADSATSATTSGSTQSIAGLMASGSNVTLTGSGTASSPYTISSAGNSPPVGPQYHLPAFNGSGSGSAYNIGSSNLATDASGNNMIVPGNVSAKLQQGIFQMSQYPGGLPSFLISPDAVDMSQTVEDAAYTGGGWGIYQGGFWAQSSQAWFQGVYFKSSTQEMHANLVTITFVNSPAPDNSAVTVSGDNVYISILKSDGTTVRTADEVVAAVTAAAPTTTHGGLVTASKYGDWPLVAGTSQMHDAYPAYFPESYSNTNVIGASKSRLVIDPLPSTEIGGPYTMDNDILVARNLTRDSAGSGRSVVAHNTAVSCPYPGWNYGNDVLGQGLWFGCTGYNLDMKLWNRGMATAFSGNGTRWSPGDSNLWTSYWNLSPGILARSDEGVRLFQDQMFELGMSYGQIHCSTNNCAGSNMLDLDDTEIGSERYLIDTSEQTITGTISSWTSSNNLVVLTVSNTNLTPSSNGVTAADISVERNVDVAPTTVTFTTTGTSCNVGDPLFIYSIDVAGSGIGDSDFSKVQSVTAVSGGQMITAELYFSHTANSQVSCGGLAAHFIHLPFMDSVSPSDGSSQQYWMTVASNTSNTITIGVRNYGGFRNATRIMQSTDAAGNPIPFTVANGCEVVDTRDTSHTYNEPDGHHVKCTENTALWSNGSNWVHPNNLDQAWGLSHETLWVSDSQAIGAWHDVNLTGFQNGYFDYIDANNGNSAASYPDLRHVPMLADMHGIWGGIIWDTVPVGSGADYNHGFGDGIPACYLCSWDWPSEQFGDGVYHPKQTAPHRVDLLNIHNAGVYLNYDATGTTPVWSTNPANFDISGGTFQTYGNNGYSKLEPRFLDMQGAECNGCGPHIKTEVTIFGSSPIAISDWARADYISPNYLDNPAYGQHLLIQPGITQVANTGQPLTSAFFVGSDSNGYTQQYHLCGSVLTPDRCVMGTFAFGQTFGADTEHSALTWFTSATPAVQTTAISSPTAGQVSIDGASVGDGQGTLKASALIANSGTFQSLSLSGFPNVLHGGDAYHSIVFDSTTTFNTWNGFSFVTNADGKIALSMNPSTGVSFYGGVAAVSPSGTYHETLMTPSSSSAACAAGDFADDANYHYVCVATNTWKRVALATW